MIQGADFLAGRVPALLVQASGLSLRASLEIGSSFGIQSHQYMNPPCVGFCLGLVRNFSNSRSFKINNRQDPYCVMYGKLSIDEIG